MKSHASHALAHCSVRKRRRLTRPICTKSRSKRVRARRAMEHSEEVFCFACGTQLEKRRGDRRLIFSPQSSYVFPMPLTLAIAESRAKSGDVQLDEAKLRAGYICRPCFRAFEKLHKLKEQIQTAQKRLSLNAKTALPYLPTLPSCSQIEQGAESMEYSTSQPDHNYTTSQSKKRRTELRELTHAPASSGSICCSPVALRSPPLRACSQVEHEIHDTSESMECSTSQPESRCTTPHRLQGRRKERHAPVSSASTSSPPVAVSHTLCTAYQYK